jgi:hypothetical protein
MDWYRAWKDGADLRDKTNNQIGAYETLLGHLT